MCQGIAIVLQTVRTDDKIGLLRFAKLKVLGCKKFVNVQTS